MLVIRHPLQQPSRSDDRGAVLVAVVIVMVVGFVVATVIAASVLVTVRGNDGNRDSLDAFVAAESGRDIARESIADGCPDTSFSSTGTPAYESAVYVMDDAEFAAAGEEPRSSAGLSEGCPTVDTAFVVINSIGTGPDGSSVEIDSVYPWQRVLEQQPGGTLAYFGGTVSGQKSVYDGDLVLRSGSYTCPNEATIDGDLWVLNGSATLSSKCTVTGSIYVFGIVDVSSQDITIGGDIIANGEIELSSNGVIVGGDIHSGISVTLDETGATTGTVGGDLIAPDVDYTAGGKWTVAGAVQEGAGVPEPVFSPTLADVYDMTAWFDLYRSNWSPEVTAPNPCSLFNPTSLLDDATTRLMIDYTGCSLPGGQGMTITLNATSVTRDVVFVVPANRTMNVDLKGNLSSSTPVETAPQLMFVHEDSNLATTASGEPQPLCQSSGPDSLDTAATVTSIQPRLLLYTPCTLSGSVRLSYSGQFYTAGNSVNFSNGAQINCIPMSWTPAFEELSCYVKGEEGAEGPIVLVQRLGDLRHQTEK